MTDLNTLNTLQLTRLAALHGVIASRGQEEGYFQDVAKKAIDLVMVSSMLHLIKDIAEVALQKQSLAAGYLLMVDLENKLRKERGEIMDHFDNMISLVASNLQQQEKPH